MCRTHQHRTTFASWDVEKVHAVVARSTFPSQNVNNTPCSDHFWKLRCRKSVHRCGAKRISKFKVLKTDGLGALLGVDMSKKCRPLWREAHFEVKSAKIWGVYGALFDVRMSFCVAGARDSAPCQKWEKTWGVYSSCNYNHHYTTLHYTTPHYYTTVHYTTRTAKTTTALH